MQAETSRTIRLIAKPKFTKSLTKLYHTVCPHTLILCLDDGGCRDTGLARAVINVTFLKYPDAFNQSGDHCTCEDRLLAYNAECIITDNEFYIKRKAGSTFWVNALYLNGDYEGLILYKTCPKEYCKTGEVDINLRHSVWFKSQWTAVWCLCH